MRIRGSAPNLKMEQLDDTGCYLQLPADWVPADALERAFKRAGDPHGDRTASLLITIPSGCKVMVDSATRLLSLANQIAYRGRPVTLLFEDGEVGTMGYLNRLGFFDLLHAGIITVPDRPSESGASLFGGTNPNVVEFKRIHPTERQEALPTQLADALERACFSRPDCKTLGQAAFTVFAELIQNVYYHSNTPIDGFAALQVYRNGGSALVAVSDSGDGLLQTLRPTLADGVLARLSDPELIVRMLNEGVSRLGPERGAGLRCSAEQAIKYRAELSLRLPTSSLRLVPGEEGYQATAFGSTGLPRLWGTHFAFKFHLADRR